jgi:hypothetical protein
MGVYRVNRNWQSCYCRQRHWCFPLLAFRDNAVRSFSAVEARGDLSSPEEMTSFEKLDKGKTQPLMTRGGIVSLERELCTVFEASCSQRKALTSRRAKF